MIDLLAICSMTVQKRWKYRVHRKKYSEVWLVIMIERANTVQSWHGYGPKYGQTHDCKIKLCEIPAGIERVHCVKAYISAHSHAQSRKWLVENPGWDYREDQLTPSNSTISNWDAKFKGRELS